jgi:glyoxylase I family protein
MPTPNFVTAFHGVRYQVSDVARSVAFYTNNLGFDADYQHLPAFASVRLDGLTLLLSGPTASGSRPLPSGERQQPGGSNRVVLRVEDLPACIERLKTAGLHFRGDMQVGPGGSQIQIEDPDGNPVELFEPGARG